VTVPQKCFQPMRAGLEAPVVEEVRPHGGWIPYALGAGVIAAGVCAITCDGDDGGGRVKPPERSPDGGNNDN
jgi:hypothetical protein